MSPIEEHRELAEGVGEGPDYQGWRGRGRLAHRRHVGGLWEEMGQRQLDFLIGQGLARSDRLLDVGCGSLRAGRHLVSYLDPGNYYGVDVNLPVIEAGFERELTDVQRERLPEANLRATDRFYCDFGVPFDMAIAQSVFSHLSLNMLRLCLWRVGKVMRPGGRFFVTFFERDDDFPIDGVDPEHHLHTERNNYWYYRDDMAWASERTPWEFRYIGDWDHPRGQRMVEYTRLDAEAT